MSKGNDGPKEYSIEGNVTVEFKPQATMSYGYLQSGKLRSDLQFLVTQYRDELNSAESRRVYARNAIIMIAFYFECLSNTLFSSSDRSWVIPTEKYGGISKPIRRFIALYEINEGNVFTLDYMGVQDLFHIRNKVFAHAPEATITSSNNLKELTKLQYSKFISYPHSYIEFGESHADELLVEVTTFLIAYTKLLSGSLPSWWVREYDK